MRRQGAIIDQFLSYMETRVDKQNSAELESFQKKYHQIKRGLCFGFSVVHSYMAATGKLDWWERVIAALMQWNGSSESLRQPSNDVTLLSMRPSKNTTNLLSREAMYPPASYEELFERAAGYVLFQQSPEDFLPGVEYVSFLQPNGMFESEKGKIKQYVSAAGNFSEEQLDALLQPAIFSQEEIILIMRMNHACSLRYSNEKQAWYFYDPNYYSGEKEFQNKKALISEIQRVLGNSIGIRIASWRTDLNFENFSVSYAEILKESKKIMDNLGLHLIALDSPENLIALVASAEKNPDRASALSKALTEKTKVRQWTGLHIIARYAPQDTLNSVDKLIELAEKNTSIVSALSKALTEKDNDQCTGLHMIARCAPNSVDKLIELAGKNTSIASALSKALTEKDNDQWTGLHMIAKHAPNSVVKFISTHKDAAFKNDAFRIALYQLLGQKTKEGDSVFKLSDCFFTGFIALIKTSEALAEEAIKIIDDEMILIPAKSISDIDDIRANIKQRTNQSLVKSFQGKSTFSEADMLYLELDVHFKKYANPGSEADRQKKHVIEAALKFLSYLERHKNELTDSAELALQKYRFESALKNNPLYQEKKTGFFGESTTARLIDRARLLVKDPQVSKTFLS